MNKQRITFGEILFGFVACVAVIYLSLTFTPKEKTIHNYYQVLHLLYNNMFYQILFLHEYN